MNKSDDMARFLHFGGAITGGDRSDGRWLALPRRLLNRSRSDRAHGSGYHFVHLWFNRKQSR